MKFFQMFSKALMTLTVTLSFAVANATTNAGTNATETTEAEEADVVETVTTTETTEMTETSTEEITDEVAETQSDDQAQIEAQILDAAKTEEAKAPEAEIVKENKPAANVQQITKSASAIEAPAFDQGFRNFAHDCSMRLSPGMEGEIVGIVRKGKNLWVEDASTGWAKVYRKSGPAYVEKECL